MAPLGTYQGDERSCREKKAGKELADVRSKKRKRGALRNANI